MALDRDRPLLCFVHSVGSLDGGAGELVERGRDAWGDVDLVQVRGQRMRAGELERLVLRWLGAVEGRATRIIVNDRLDVALAAGAHGVHLGRSDLPTAEVRRAAPGLLLGASAHDRAELQAVQLSGADYAGLGAFHASRTKPEALRLDPARAGLLEPVPGLRIPVLAIGGIQTERIASALAVPVVTGVAVSEAIQAAPDPRAAIAVLRSALDEAWAHREAAIGPVRGGA